MQTVTVAEAAEKLTDLIDAEFIEQLVEEQIVANGIEILTLYNEQIISQKLV